VTDYYYYEDHYVNDKNFNHWEVLQLLLRYSNTQSLNSVDHIDEYSYYMESTVVDDACVIK
jgi:hypothetical protein